MLGPQALQAAITAAYTAAEEQDSSAAAAEATLAAMPEVEADVARAELAQIKLSGGAMVDGRLLAAYRELHSACAAAVERLQSDWQQHVREAVGLRSRQILAGMPTSLLDDLQQLAAWEHESGDLQHGFDAMLRHYGPLLEEEHAAALAAQLGGGGCSGSAAAGPAAAPGPCSSNMLPVVYRAGKKAILWDAVLLR